MDSSTNEATARQPRRKRGPKTAAGKARVAKNAVKHAIYYFYPVLIEGKEFEEDWIEFRDGIVESLLAPGASGGLGDGPPTKSNRLEEELADKIALVLWRWRRLSRYETAAINHHVQTTETDVLIGDLYLAPDKEAVEAPEPMRLQAHQEKALIPRENDLNLITRYEAHLHRLFLQLSHELEAIQARRRGDKPNVARIDVIASPRGAGAPSQPKIPEMLERPLSVLEKNGA